jgi:hypothetical protein
MKEQAQASTICRYLDEGAEHLPFRVVERLAAARAQALARIADPAPASPAAAFAPPLTSADGAASPARRTGAMGTGIQMPTPHAPATWRPSVFARDSKPSRESRTPFWWRFAATVVPLLMLAVGVLVVDSVHQEQSAAELAEVDSALLTDDVPLVAYADRGFGVYIKNTRR